MYNILKDILIITESGKVIASKIQNPQIEDQLFGMLVSALNSFTKEITKENLNYVEFNNLRFDFLRKDQFIFVASSFTRVKHKKAVRTLKKLSELFFEKYPEKLISTWDGSLNIFQDVDTYINKSIDEVVIDMIFKERKIEK